MPKHQSNDQLDRLKRQLTIAIQATERDKDLNNQHEWMDGRLSAFKQALELVEELAQT